MSASSTNDLIADAIVAEARAREGYGASALLNASRIIREFPTPITDAKQLKGVSGIGKGTLERVARILELGAAYRPPTPPPSQVAVAAAAAAAEAGVSPASAATAIVPSPEALPADAFDFCTLKFFGPVAKRNLYAQGIYTRAQLEKQAREHPESLNANQLAGLRFCDDLAERIPRDEVEEIAGLVVVAAQQEGMSAHLVGSYRRGKESSGDVDVLITGEKNWLHRVVDRLYRDGLLQYTFSLGEVKAMIVAVSPRTGIFRSLDIRFVPASDWASFLLFSTGPFQLNVVMRQAAIDRGWKLSEYGLFDTEGRRLPVVSEEELFCALDMEYLTPEERERYNVD